MAGTFSSIFNPGPAASAANPEAQPFEPESGGDNPNPPVDDGSGPPPEIASGGDADFGG